MRSMQFGTAVHESMEHLSHGLMYTVYRMHVPLHHSHTPYACPSSPHVSSTRAHTPCTPVTTSPPLHYRVTVILMTTDYLHTHRPSIDAPRPHHRSIRAMTANTATPRHEHTVSTVPHHCSTVHQLCAQWHTIHTHSTREFRSDHKCACGTNAARMRVNDGTHRFMAFT